MIDVQIDENSLTLSNKTPTRINSKPPPKIRGRLIKPRNPSAKSGYHHCNFLWILVEPSLAPGFHVNLCVILV